MDIPSTGMEFSVNMTCESCANTIKQSFSNKPVEVISIDVPKQQVIVESKLPFSEVQDIIESCGKEAALVGYGTNVGKGSLGAAVAEVSGKFVKGVVRMAQLNNDTCLFEGTIDGLLPGEHGINIHEFGDLSNGCESCGEHFNPYSSKHGGRLDRERHVGDLGNITANENGRASFKFIDDKVKIWDVIGRSLVVHDRRDDLGYGAGGTTNVDGNAGPGIACAIIARSAALFQNPKRVCLCDGVIIWDEKNVPVAGRERAKQKL